MISNILIERPSGAAKVTISTARPGIVIGKKKAKILRNYSANLPALWVFLRK